MRSFFIVNCVKNYYMCMEYLMNMKLKIYCEGLIKIIDLSKFDY